MSFLDSIPLAWYSSTLATSCEELTHWKRLWCWEGLWARGEGDNRGWDGWMASPTRWIWVWVNSGSWLWTGRPGLLWFMGSQWIRHDWVTELNWTEYMSIINIITEDIKRNKLFLAWGCHFIIWESPAPRWRQTPQCFNLRPAAKYLFLGWVEGENGVHFLKINFLIYSDRRSIYRWLLRR